MNTPSPKPSFLPTFPVRIKGSVPKKPEDLTIPKSMLYWLIAITVLLLAETAYLIKKNLETTRGFNVNPPPSITYPTPIR